MSDRVEKLKKLILSMTHEELDEMNKWIYDLFKFGCDDSSWDDVVDETSSILKALDSKPN